MSEQDDADFRAYVASRQRALRRTAFFMCGDWHAADDLVQTTLTKLYAAWHRVTSANGPDAYAHRILANVMIDERRRPSRREFSTASIFDREDTTAASTRSDERLDIATALASLEELEQATSVPAAEWCRRFAEGAAAGVGVDD